MQFFLKKGTLSHLLFFSVSFFSVRKAPALKWRISSLASFLPKLLTLCLRWVSQRKGRPLPRKEVDSLLCGHQVRVSANLCPLLIWHRLVTWQVSHDHWGHQQVPSGLLRAKAHSGYCSFPPLPHFTCGSSLQFCKVDETAAPLVCTQHLWSLTRSSSSPNPSLGFERNYFPPTNFFNFRLSLIFSALTPKMPALHKAAETKAIYKCQGIGVPISEAVDTLLLKGLPELLKIVGDLSDWVSLERTKKEIRVRYPLPWNTS